jgi:dimethylargininase
VGISERTNAESARILEDALGIPTILVPFEGNALHLKSIVTHVDDTTLLAPEGSLGDHVLEVMEAANLGYDIIRLPRMLACNVVSVNGGLLAQDVGCRKSKEILQEVASERNLDIEFLSFSEYAKADGALTCCSILLNI